MVRPKVLSCRQSRVRRAVYKHSMGILRSGRPSAETRGRSLLSSQEYGSDDKQRRAEDLMVMLKSTGPFAEPRQDLQQATASEPLTLKEEYDMQSSWPTDVKKLTFIVCQADWCGTVHTRDVDREENAMVGDVSMFISVVDEDDDSTKGMVVGVNISTTASGTRPLEILERTSSKRVISKQRSLKTESLKTFRRRIRQSCDSNLFEIVEAEKTDGYNHTRSLVRYAPRMARAAADVKSIFVGDLPQWVTEQQLRDHFIRFGVILNKSFDIGDRAVRPGLSGVSVATLSNLSHVSSEYDFGGDE